MFFDSFMGGLSGSEYQIFQTGMKAMVSSVSLPVSKEQKIWHWIKVFSEMPG